MNVSLRCVGGGAQVLDPIQMARVAARRAAAAEAEASAGSDLHKQFEAELEAAKQKVDEARDSSGKSP